MEKVPVKVCFRACPFSAVMEKSQLVQVLCALHAGEKLTAVVAPAAAWQFPGSVEQLFAAIRALGFDDVVEVARGAEMTTEHEAREFVERQKEGKGLMTTSCCPAWVNLVSKHLPAFLPHVSDTPSPMVYAAGKLPVNFLEVMSCKGGCVGGPCSLHL